MTRERAIPKPKPRRATIVDLLIGVFCLALTCSGVRSVTESSLPTADWAVGLALYGAAAAWESRSGWSNGPGPALTASIYFALILSTLSAFCLLSVLCPMAALAGGAAEAMVLFWSSSWI